MRGFSTDGICLNNIEPRCENGGIIGQHFECTEKFIHVRTDLPKRKSQPVIGGGTCGYRPVFGHYRAADTKPVA